MAKFERWEYVRRKKFIRQRIEQFRLLRWLEDNSIILRTKWLDVNIVSVLQLLLSLRIRFYG